MHSCTETYIFSVPEIEFMIFDYLCPKEKSSLIFVSKYYYETISTFPLYLEMKKFHKTKEACGLDDDARNHNHIGDWYDHIDITNKFIIACKNGYLFVAKYYFEFLHEQYISYMFDRIFVKVCENGHFEMMKWLDGIELGVDKNYTNAFIESCKNGHLEIGQYLYSKHDKNFPYGNSVGDYAFGLSCQNGHIEVVKYLYSLGFCVPNYFNSLLLKSGRVFEKSCANGHIEVVKFLVSNRDNRDQYDIHANNEGAFRKSCRNGHIDVVKLLISIDETINISAKNHYALRKSCQNGHVEVVKFLLRPDSLYVTDTFFKKLINKCFLTSCRNGHLEVIEYMLSLKNHFNINDAFRIVCSNNHLKLVKYFISKTEFYNKIYIPDSELLIDCCRNGHLDIVKFLYQLNEMPDHKISFRLKKNDVFNVSCKRGHLKIAKWIYQLAIQSGEKINIKDFIKYISKHNRFKHHKVAKFIYSLNQKLPSNERMINSFKLSCVRGNLKMAKWIYNLCRMNNFKINISHDDYFLFKESCERGHAGIAEWLYSLDHRSKDAVILRKNILKSCYSNDWVDMAKLLVKIWPERYHVLIYDNTIIECKQL